MKGLVETEESSCPWEAPVGSSCEVRAPQIQLVWLLWDGCAQRLQVQNVGPRPRKKSQGWRHISAWSYRPIRWAPAPGQGLSMEQETCVSKPRSGCTLVAKTMQGFFNIHFNVLLMGLFVWLRLERKLHSPDSLAAKVLDLISNSPNRIPHGDLDLGTELSGRRQASGHPFAGKRSRGSTVLQSTVVSCTREWRSWSGETR